MPKIQNPTLFPNGGSGVFLGESLKSQPLIVGHRLLDTRTGFANIDAGLNYLARVFVIRECSTQVLDWMSALMGKRVLNQTFVRAVRGS